MLLWSENNGPVCWLGSSILSELFVLCETWLIVEKSAYSVTGVSVVRHLNVHAIPKYSVPRVPTTNIEIALRWLLYFSLLHIFLTIKLNDIELRIDSQENKSCNN